MIFFTVQHSGGNIPERRREDMSMWMDGYQISLDMYTLFKSGSVILDSRQVKGGETRSSLLKVTPTACQK
jgi:hypothetical protein